MSQIVRDGIRFRRVRSIAFRIPQDTPYVEFYSVSDGRTIEVDHSTVALGYQKHNGRALLAHDGLVYREV